MRTYFFFCVRVYLSILSLATIVLHSGCSGISSFVHFVLMIYEKYIVFYSGKKSPAEQKSIADRTRRNGIVGKRIVNVSKYC